MSSSKIPDDMLWDSSGDEETYSSLPLWGGVDNRYLHSDEKEIYFRLFYPRVDAEVSMQEVLSELDSRGLLGTSDAEDFDIAPLRSIRQ